MTTRTKLVLLGIVSLMGFAAYVMASTSPDLIQVAMRKLIRAGDPLSVTVKIDGATAGDTVHVTLVNGLHFFDETLLMGTGGIAVWEIPPDTIIQVGTSLLLARYNDLTVRHPLTVLPLSTDQIEVFSTANNIVSYGTDSTTIMMLAEDQWGNVPSERDQFDIKVIYPDTSRTSGEFTVLNGLGLYTLTSYGVSGRVRIQAFSGDVVANLELQQIPSQAHDINVSVSPQCVLNDARDLVTISIEVTDQQRQAVANGTLVTVRWDDGMGFARTLNGIATLRLPAFDIVGQYVFSAQSGGIISSDEFLQVVEDTCLE